MNVKDLLVYLLHYLSPKTVRQSNQHVWENVCKNNEGCKLPNEPSDFPSCELSLEDLLRFATKLATAVKKKAGEINEGYKKMDPNPNGEDSRITEAMTGDATKILHFAIMENVNHLPRRTK